MSRYNYNNYFQSLEEEGDVTNGWDYEEEEEYDREEYEHYDHFEYTGPNPVFQFEADQIRIGLEQNTTVKELKLTNFTPELIKATAEGLRDSNTVETVVMEQNIYGYSTITQDALPYLRQILSIPKIRFKIIRKNDSMILEAIRGDSAKYITHLTVTTNSAQLNEMLNELCYNNVIEYIYIDRLSLESACNSISVFGNFKLLTQLRIRIRGDECEQFFKAMRHGVSLNHLDISNSIIPSEQAQHLADLIAANSCGIKYLDLSDCAIDDKALSIICNEVVRNKSIETLCLKDNPFERLDLPSGLTSLPKKKLQHMTTHVFDENMDKIFYMDRLYITGDNFDGLKTARINRLAIERLHKIQQVTNLFDSFKNNNNIKALRLLHVDGHDTIMEVCKRLKVDRVLRSVDTGFMPFSESSLKLFCQAIIENDTLEALTHSGDFHAESDGTGYSKHGDTDVLEALKKNKSLTKVDFVRFDCKDREIEQVLTANPFITFVRLDDRSRRSRVTELNDKNKRNIAKRITDIKLNVISLARSRWSRKLPIEIWQLIMDFLRGLDVDYFDLFQSNVRLK